MIAKATVVNLLEDNTPNLNPDEITEQLSKLDMSHLNNHEQNALKDVLLRNSKVFSTKHDPIGEITIVEHSLDIPEGQISFVPQYRQPKACQDALTETVKELLHFKVIKECESPFNSPILMVSKPDNTWRFCIDMRQLNKITPYKPFPIPQITQTLNELVGMQYFTTLDAKSGYHHINLKEEDKIKTAFRTNDGTYCFNRMPFGLRNAGFTYQMAMNRLLFTVLGKCSLVYIDDVILYSRTFLEHLEHLQVFTLLINGGAKLNMKKCVFAKPSIKYLGYIVDGFGVYPDSKKVEAFKNFPVPVTAKQIKQFLASVGFYRHLIPDFAKYSACLSDLLKKDAKFEWTDRHMANFDYLRNCLCNSPILRHPNFNKQFELHTDACNENIASALMQRGTDGIPYPVSYFSRKLRTEEKKYCTTELEALAIVSSIKHFHYYLYGTSFLVVTDHLPLKTIFENRSKNSRIARWGLFLQEYDFTCMYKSGKIHFLPDALSRNVNDFVVRMLTKKVSASKEGHKYLKHLPSHFKLDEIFSKANVLKEQLAESRWCELITYLKGGMVVAPPNRTWLDEFMVYDDVLFYKSDKLANNYRLVVPNSLIPQALFMAHDGQTSNHCGFVKTLNQVRKYFYWPNLASDVKLYCKTCLPCQKRKPGLHPNPPYGTFEEVTYPGQRVGIDLVGPWPETSKGNTFILTIIDHFSRFMELFAIPSKHADDVAFAFSKYLIKHGGVDFVVSDQGTEFINSVLRALFLKFDINKKPTAAFHPQANGMTENRNRIIGDTL